MPNTPEAVVAMLACARLGAVHSVVFGGFAPRELAVRIDDARPKAILYGSCGIEPNRVIPYQPLIDQALELAAHRPDAIVVHQRSAAPADPRPDTHDWDELLGGAASVEAVAVEAGEPLYILYTSGTSGRPKGVVRDHGGYATALLWSMSHVYGAAAGEVFWTASDVGWVVGHSYMVYAPLLLAATTVIYEGKPVGTPDSAAFWRVADEHGVRTLFTAPTALRAIRQADPGGDGARRHDLTALRSLFLAGERTDPATLTWATDLLGLPVIDHWWQTETGWPIAANCLGIERLPVKAGSVALPVPGFDVRVVDDAGADLPPGRQGQIVLGLPLPPGAATTLWNDEDGYAKAYLARHPGRYTSGDAGRIDEDGYLCVLGRVDDVINVAGHRLSTGSIEQAAAAHPAVAEAAVVGVDDPLKGQVPLVLLVLAAGDHDPDAVRREVRAAVRREVGAIATPGDVRVVPRLPKTRSGKVLRRSIRQLAAGDDVTVPSTIEDTAALDELRAAVASAEDKR